MYSLTEESKKKKIKILIFFFFFSIFSFSEQHLIIEIHLERAKVRIQDTECAHEAAQQDTFIQPNWKTCV